MVQSSFARLLTLVVALFGASVVADYSMKTNRMSRRLSLVDERHGKVVPEKNYSPVYTQSQVSYLMVSDCRPSMDGYFGGTYGRPVVIEYGFEMESEPTADLDHVIDVVHEHVMDSVLSTTFPNVCGFQRRLQKISEKRGDDLRPKVTGFHFDRDEYDFTRKLKTEWELCDRSRGSLFSQEPVLRSSMRQTVVMWSKPRWPSSGTIFTLASRNTCSVPHEQLLKTV